MIVEFDKIKKISGQRIKQIIIQCKDCAYFKPFKDAEGYGSCQANHTFDGAFRDCDYCSYAQIKQTM